MDEKKRERLVLMGGVVAVAVMLILFLGFKVVGKSSQLDGDISAQKRRLNEALRVATEYSLIHQRAGKYRQKVRKGTPLLSYVEQLSHQAGIPNPALNPRRTQQNDYFEETSVELKAKELNLEQVATLLKNIETSPRFLRIKYFQAKTPYAKKDLLDLTLQISAYSPKETSETASPKVESP